MTDMLHNALLAVLAGPFAVAGLAKLSVPGDRLSWPYDSGPLRAPHGPRLVGAAECATAVALMLLPGWPAAAIATAAYAALSLAAARLRGRRCACFGVARLAAVNGMHIAATAGGSLLGAVLLVAALLAAPEPRPLLRVPVAAVCAALVLFAVLKTDRRAASATPTAGCDRRLDSVRLYVNETCPACRSIQQLLSTMEGPRRAAVTVTVLAKGEELPEPLAELGVPCAVGEADGEQVCGPALGVGPVKALIDQITIAPLVR